jgi:hypothetical protein
MIRQIRIEGILLLFLFIIGCSGGGNGNPLVVSLINGPNTIDDATCEVYNVAVTYATGSVSYIWTCLPDTAGYFTKPAQSSTSFCANAVTENTQVTLSVQVFFDSDPTQTRQTIVTIEAGPPYVGITNCPDTVPNSSFTFEWSMSDDETPQDQLKVEIRKDDVNWEEMPNGATSYNWSDIPPGEHTFQVQVTDDDDPTHSTIGICSFSCPSQECWVGITNCPSEVHQPDYKFEWTITSSVKPLDQVKVEIRKDEEDWEQRPNGALEYTWFNIPEGYHDFHVKVTCDNLSFECNCISFERIIDPPFVGILNCQSGIIGKSYTFIWSISDAETPRSELEVEIREDQGDWVPLPDGSTSYEWVFDCPFDGNHTFYVRVTNKADKPAEDFCPFNANPNNEPYVGIRNCPGWVHGPQYSFNWYKGDVETPLGQIAVKVFLNGEEKVLADCSTDYQWTDIPYGENTFEVEVTDTGVGGDPPCGPAKSKTDKCVFIRD